MQIGIIVSGVIALIIELATGLRLLLLSQRTKGVPELLIGLSFFFAGLLNMTGTIYKMAGLQPYGPIVAVLLQFFHLLMTMSLFVGIWRIFRPSQNWAAFVCMLIGLTLMTIILMRSLEGFEMVQGRTWWKGMNNTIVILGLLWGCVESVHYHLKLKRQQKLGLADSLTANRFLMWAISCFSFLCFYAALYLYVWKLVPKSFYTVGYAVFALIGSAAIWITFFPPQIWRRWLEAKDRRQSQT